MVTIYDIAKKSGYAPATVSKALNNKPDISEKTRKAIQRLAKEMGYSPNSQAIALTTNKTWNIGVLMIDRQYNGLTHYLFSHILESIRYCAERQGYDITFISETVAGKEATYLEHVRYRRCDGVIIACVDFEQSSINELVHSGLPVVTIDHVFDKTDTSTIKSDNGDGMRQIVHYLKEKRYKKIVYMHGENCYVTSQRVQSFINTCNELFEDECYELIKGCYFSKADAYNKTNLLLENNKQIPDIIIYPDDYSAIGGIKGILEHGYKIPEDIAVIGFDGIELGELVSPAVTTIKQNTKKMGQLAVNELIRRMEESKSKSKIIKVPVKLIERQSSAKK